MCVLNVMFASIFLTFKTFTFLMNEFLSDNIEDNMKITLIQEF